MIIDITCQCSTIELPERHPDQDFFWFSVDKTAPAIYNGKFSWAFNLEQIRENPASMKLSVQSASYVRVNIKNSWKKNYCKKKSVCVNMIRGVLGFVFSCIKRDYKSKQEKLFICLGNFAGSGSL